MISINRKRTLRRDVLVRNEEKNMGPKKLDENKNKICGVNHSYYTGTDLEICCSMKRANCAKICRI